MHPNDQNASFAEEKLLSEIFKFKLNERRNTKAERKKWFPDEKKVINVRAFKVQIQIKSVQVWNSGDGVDDWRSLLYSSTCKMFLKIHL